MRAYKHKTRCGRRLAKGFSLIELIIVIVLLGIIAGVGSQLMAAGFRSYFLGRDLTAADWQGRLALERMTREIREIPSSVDLTTMAANQIGFNDMSGNAVSYSLGASLLRNIQPLADNVTALNFTYLDGNGAATAVAADVRFISIGVDISRGGASMTLRTMVHARSLP